MSDITVFICGSPPPPPCSVPGCGKPRWTTCVMELGGRLAGRLCGAALCSVHGGDGALCPPHHRLMERRLLETDK